MSIGAHSAAGRCAPVTLGLVCVALWLLAPSAQAGVANRGLPHASRSNPLAGMQWGVYTGPYYNSIHPEYQQARGRTRQLLGKIALRPLMFTFGGWFSDSMLEQAGVRCVRGFSLNTSEYDTTSSEVEYGARLVQALAKAGIRGTHFVLNTAENGAGFLNDDYPGDVNHPRVCSSSHDRLCVTLGIPPTTQVASRRWQLSGADARLAFRYVDAYVWAGRPWLGDAGQFERSARSG
jgi:hypothetical protein